MQDLQAGRHQNCLQLLARAEAPGAAQSCADQSEAEAVDGHLLDALAAFPRGPLAPHCQLLRG